METVVATPLYSARALPADEWGKCAGVLPADLSALDPDHAIVVVVEDASGAVVAGWVAMNTVHLEGLYVDPAHRKNPVVAKALTLEMIATLRTARIPQVVTLIQEDAVRTLAETFGFVQVPGTLHRLDL